MKAVPIAELILVTIRRARALSDIDLRAVIGIGDNVLDFRYKDSDGERLTHAPGSVSIVIEGLIDNVWVVMYRNNYGLNVELNKDQAMRLMLVDLITEGLVDLKKEYELKLK